MTLKSGLRDQSRSFKLVPFESLGAVSYSPSIVTMALSCIISKIKRDIGQKSSFFHTPLHSSPPSGGFPSEYCHSVWCWKTRMAWLPDSEKIWRYDYPFWRKVRTWQTHRHRMRAKAALDASRCKNVPLWDPWEPWPNPAPGWAWKHNPIAVTVYRLHWQCSSYSNNKSEFHHTLWHTTHCDCLDVP